MYINDVHIAYYFVAAIIGLFVGANISLILYACIVAGKESDRRSGYTE